MRGGASPQMYFRAEPDLQAAIKEAAEKDHRSVSDFLRLIVWGELERRGVMPKRKRSSGRSPTLQTKDRTRALPPERLSISA